MWLRVLLFAGFVCVAAEDGPVAWLETEKVRAAYHYGRPPVAERMDRLQQAGINCLILKCGTERAMPWLVAARKRGMHAFLAFNFNIAAAKKGFRPAVLDRGEVEAYACPLDQRFWLEHLTPAVMERVELSADPRYEVSGLWIDFELYSTVTGQRYYTRGCYCDHCFGEYCRHAGVATPDVTPKDRKGWLKEQGHDVRYQPYLQTRIEALASDLRRKIHAVNPGFLLGFYPSPHNWSLVGVARGFATESVPILIWGTDTYGGGGADRVPKDWRQHYAKQGINARYIAGLLLRRYSARNLAANLYHTTQACDGYWLFTTYTLSQPVAKHKGDYYLAFGEPKEYWGAIRTGNAEIAKGLAAGPGYASQLAVGPEPITHHMLHRPKLRERLARVVPPPAAPMPAKLPRVLLRGTNVLVVAGQAGQPTEITLGFHAVNNGKGPIVWQALDRDGNDLASGVGPKSGDAKLVVPPQRERIFFVLASAGRSCWQVTGANCPVGLYAGTDLHTMHGAKQLFFRVPEGVEEFSIAGKGSSTRETVRVSVTNPKSKTVATGESDGRKLEATLNVATGKDGAGIWSLTIGKAQEGILEDSMIRLPEPLPPVLSLHPDWIFGIRRK